jgi:hypothetical protein
MAGTRVEIAKRHITGQQQKIIEYEVRIAALLDAGHLSEVELEFEQRLLRRLKAYERYLELCAGANQILPLRATALSRDLSLLSCW